MLAELMLPDGVHARTEDWTVFFLSRQSDSNRPKTPGDEAQSVDTSAAESVEKAKGRENLTYVLNLVRTKHDNTVRRGALVKAIAIGTRHPYIQAFRPALLLAIDEYFRTPEIDVLARLYDALNSFDMTAVPSFSFNEKLILRATDRRNMFEERFGDQWLSTAPLDARNANGNSLAEYGASNDSAQDPRSASMSRSKDPSGSDNSSYSHDEFLSHMQQQSPDAGNTSSFRPRVKQKPSFPSLRQNYSSGGAASHLGGGLGGKRLPSGPNPPHIEPKGGVGLEASLPKDTHIFETFVMYGKTTEIPIRIPTDLFDQEVGEVSRFDMLSIILGRILFANPCLVTSTRCCISSTRSATAHRLVRSTRIFTLMAILPQLLSSYSMPSSLASGSYFWDTICQLCRWLRTFCLSARWALAVEQRGRVSSGDASLMPT